MYKSIIYKDIFKDYEKDRDDAKRLYEKRKKEVYKKVPRIEKIDNELNRTGIYISKAILNSNNNYDKEKFLQELQEKNDSLLNEKDNLLIQNGFPKDYFFTIYKCDLCQDTGYIENKKCKCFDKRFIEKTYNMSNLKDILKEQNFDMFDINYYPEEISGNESQSPRENIKRIWSVCLDFVKNFDKNFDNLLFYGGSGLGKTFLCSCIAKDLLDKGKTVIYISAQKFFNIIENSKFGSEEEKKSGEILDYILEVDLFIIDDLGTEFSTLLSSSELYNFINSRIVDKKSTIISTNLSPQNLITQYSDRIVSRIYGNYKVLRFIGEDIRILKKSNG